MIALFLVLRVAWAVEWTRPEVAPPAVPDVPDPQVLALSDGTPVWLVERHDLPLVRVELSLRAGYLASPDPTALRLAGALLDNGTRDLDAGEWSDALADLGAEGRLGVGAMRAWADVEAVRGTEAQALALVAEALRRPALSRRELRRVRKAWVESRRAAGLRGASVHEAATTRAVYPDEHALGQVYGPEDYGRVNRRRAKVAHRWLLATGRPAIVVVGDTTADTILPLLESTWAGIGGALEPRPLAAPPIAGPRIILVDHPGTAMAVVTAALPAPEAFAPDLPANEIAVTAFAGAFTSRLNLNLREDKGYTYGIEGSIRAWPGHGRFEITTSVRNEALVGALEEIFDELWRLTAQPLDEAEIRAARRSLLVEGAQDLVTLESLAFRYGVLATYGQPPAALQGELTALAGASDDDVRAAAQVLVGTNDLVWVITADRRVVEPLLEAGGWTPDAVWSGRAVVRSRGVEP